MRFEPTVIHGILDYVVGLSAGFLPFIPEARALGSAQH